MPDTARSPRPWLLADIGGTNARFGWLDAHDAQPAHVQTIPVADHAGPAQAAQAYLTALQGTLGPAYRAPRAAAFAVATAVAGDTVEFTNSGWAFSRAATQQTLGLDTLRVLNDFEALALSLPGLRASQLQAWGDAFQTVDAARGALAVVGPGTGLGVAGLLPTAQGWVAVAGEGGHASLAPVDDFEAALLAAVRRVHAHVSAERLLSGSGLPVLHGAVVQLLGLARASAPGADALSPERIVELGLAGDDAACVQTLDSFCAMLGGFAGNVALTLGARGGVFIGGGVVPRLGEMFFASKFRERFEAKGRFRAYLQAIPTALITDTLVALSGAACALAPHQRQP